MDFSVIMPNYNHGDRIAIALDSIFNQSVLPKEVIVLDDGSTDDSLAVLERYAANQPLLRVIRFEKNRGAVDACNELFRQAKGEYILGFPADDIILPGAFERAAAMLDANPGAGVCCADYFMVDTASGKLEHYRMGFAEEACFLDPENFTERLKGWWVPSFTSFIRRDALEAAGYFLTDTRWHCDWLAYLTVAFRHGLCYIPEPLAARRRHDDAYGTKGRRNRQEQDQVLRNLLGRLKSDEFRDVMPKFVRSGAMLFFNNELDRLVMSDPGMWDNETLMLAQLPMWYRMRACKMHMDSIWDRRLDAESEHQAYINEALLDVE
ncbi:glycosyltransferase family 2 protein [Pseudodesulfovibrio cashew]|nr:glycosyltransferase family A protein [Pseudodesulfovibrio cashew]